MQHVLIMLWRVEWNGENTGVMLRQNMYSGIQYPVLQYGSKGGRKVH
jgi:hypothetical protein